MWWSVYRSSYNCYTKLLVLDILYKIQFSRNTTLREKIPSVHSENKNRKNESEKLLGRIPWNKNKHVRHQQSCKELNLFSPSFLFLLFTISLSGFHPQSFSPPFHSPLHHSHSPYGSIFFYFIPNSISPCPFSTTKAFSVLLLFLFLHWKHYTFLTSRSRANT